MLPLAFGLLCKVGMLVGLSEIVSNVTKIVGGLTVQLISPYIPLDGLCFAAGPQIHRPVGLCQLRICIVCDILKV